MAEATESEYRLLNAMSETTQYSLVELAESSGVRRERVGRLLAELIGEGYVTKYEQGERTEYRLSPTGVGKRAMMRGVAKDGPVGWGEFLKAASTAHHQAGVAATREQMAEVPLTDDDRDRCDASLRLQHEQRAFDSAELIRRQRMLAAAVTHGQLLEVFDGLRPPPLYGQESPPAAHPLQQLGSAVQTGSLVLRLLFCLPFFLAGIAILNGASNPEEYLGAAMFLGGSLFFAYPALKTIFPKLPSPRPRRPRR
jgi:DNA-binding MarR family transcriptional regulator